MNSDLCPASTSNVPYEVTEEAGQEPVFKPVYRNALKRGIELAEVASAAIKRYDGTSESLAKLLREASSLARFNCGEGEHKSGE